MDSFYQGIEDDARAKIMALMPTTISDCHKTFEQREADAKIQINAARVQKQAAQDASEAYALARQRGIDSVTPAETLSVLAAKPTPVVAVGASGGVARARAKRRTWRDVAWPYMVEVVKAGQYKTGKEFYQALKSKAGTADSPFDRGTGHHRDVLFVREISETLALKTIQTYAWKELKASRKTG